MNLTKKQRYLLSILSGALLILSFPFTGSLIFLGFVAWVPLLLVESEVHHKRFRSGKVFIHALITFTLYNVGTTWWIIYASIEGALMAFVANSLIMALVFYLFHLTKRHVGSREGYLGLIFYWIAFEYFHYNWESAWPWLSLGNIFSIQPEWVQWYSFTGVLGGSVWILLVNVLITRIYRNVLAKKETWRIQTPLIYTAIAAVALPIVISLMSYFSYSEKSNPVEVVAIQPNIDPYNEKFDSNVFGQLDKLFALAAQKVSPGTDLLVAPETAISLSFDEDRLRNINLYPYLQMQQKKLNGVPMYLGASTHRIFDHKNSVASKPIPSQGIYVEHYNTSLLFNREQEVSFVHKSKLVPGVEKIPFASTFTFLEDLSIDLGGTTGTLGVEKAPQVLRLEKFAFAPVICYESIFGEFIAEQCRKGAQLICVATNDGWWRDTPGYKQHHSFARLRAIENRRSVVRSANTGVSCFINQRGDSYAETAWWVPDVIKAEVNLNSDLTFYTRYGDALGRSFAFVSALLLVFTFVKRITPNKPSK